MQTRFNLGVWNTTLADAIQKRDLRRIGALVDVARAAGMKYNDVAQHACAASKLDPSEWESLLYEVDTAESEGWKDD